MREFRGMRDEGCEKAGRGMRARDAREKCFHIGLVMFGRLDEGCDEGCECFHIGLVMFGRLDEGCDEGCARDATRERLAEQIA